MNSALIRWVGPVLGLLGATGIALLALQPLGSRDLLSWWILERAVSIDKALPLIGVGAALSMLSPRLSILSIGAFLAGAAVGFETRSQFIAFMDFAPDAADRLFLTAPISMIAAGSVLIAPARAKPWLVLPAAFLIGAMLAIVITLTDPTMNSRTVSLVGVALGLWAVVATALSARAFYRPWFPIALRILGSWCLAIGLLYGGTSLVKRPALPSLPDEKLLAPVQRNSLPSLDEPPAGGANDGHRIDP